MLPTTRHVPIDVGPMTNPPTIATKSATTVAAATIVTRRFVGGLVLNRLLPEFGVRQRAPHRRRELIHQQTQTRTPTRRDVVVQSDDFAVFDRGDLGETGPLGESRRRRLATDRVGQEDHLRIRAQDVLRTQLRVTGGGGRVLSVSNVHYAE